MVCGQVTGPPAGPVDGVSALVLASAPEAARAGREFVADWLYDKGYDDVSVEVGRAVASELVTNAYRHAAGAGERITVRVYVSAAGPVLEVWDPSPELPEERPLDLVSTSGRGLAMVGLITGGWGVNPLASGGKSVHALLRAELDPEAAP
ncbi:ATP-binding protein [Actinomadura parmotrematis]|uniref:ATP-binding protein n=1 Tax=Actinomadura parmotrematis TaxID=2864039 RepID=A0ABS7FYW5_9ACTN|nr:ATP-binding protein [Actinomadura parmotrematis]MBW8485335.1 ATP-binding protein [Actinomadura parmotrematis]